MRMAHGYYHCPAGFQTLKVGEDDLTFHVYGKDRVRDGECE